MARGTLAANIPAASNENVPVASSTLNDFGADSSLLSLQKHVDAAAANGVANAHTVAKLEHHPQPPAHQLSAEEAAANSIAYAASAALLVTRSDNVNNYNNNNDHGHLDSDPDAIIHPDLRPAYSPPPTTTYYTMSAAPQPTAPSAQPAASPQQAPAPLPQQQPPQHTVPAPVAPQQSVSPAASQELVDVIPDGRKGPRRELSTSKRAAQNRAAQRAFRQRKEGYIKKLEQQVQEYGEMEQQFKITQTENYALREYIIHLQSRLLDAKAELPQPPANLNLSAPGMPPIMTIGPSPTQQHQQVQLQQRQQPMHLQQQQQHQAAVPAQYQEQHQHQQPAPAQSQEAAHAAAAPSAAQAVAAAAAAAAAAADERSAASDSAADTKTENDASLARVAQAVAQLGNSTAEAAPAAEAATNGASNNTKPDPETNGNDAGEPMDTSEEAITQKLQKLSEPVMSM
ncbi:hypothetical protein Sste5346_007173 [Sporothrix stenoceras]|uniref:Putative transcription factor kapC n=1 Tax=Sporothrix stenoceras TaxID=5173 RepID=A0ABR3YVY7_9PEZI